MPEIKPFLIVIIALFLLFILLVGIGFFKLSLFSNESRKTFPQELPEKTVWLALIKPSKCSECFNLKPLAESIKKNSDLNVFSFFEISDSSDEAKSLIKQLHIEKLPTLVVFGNFAGSILEKEWLEFGFKEEKYLVLSKIPAPYYLVSSQEIVGLVDAVIVKKQDCVECFDYNKIISDIKEAGVVLNKIEVLDYNSEKGIKVLESTGLSKVPLIVFSKSLSAYPAIAQDWNFGLKLDDGCFVFSEKTPYFSLKDNEVKGLVGIVYLVDENCIECYKPQEFHKPILENVFGMKFYSESTIDVSSEIGSAFVRKYNITAWPTVLLSKDALEYPAFVNSWKTVGSIEADGVFVFRDFNSFGGKFKSIN